MNKADYSSSIFPLLRLGDSCVNWSVRVWAKSEEFADVKQAATRAVKLALDEANIEISFPRMDVHLAKDGGS